MRTACLLAVVLLAGCGSGGERVSVAAPAEPRTLDLDWVEESAELGLVFRVERFVVRRGGWLVTASVTNRGSVDYLIRRPHYPGGSMFGLVLLETVTSKELRELTADYRTEPPFLEPDRIVPPLPRVLSAGTSWRGRMSGSRSLRKGSVVRILFGRFDRMHPNAGFLWVTNHAIRP